VLIIGAGGAAKSIIHALKPKAGEILIYNRTEKKAAELSKEYGLTPAKNLARLPKDKPITLAINCTDVYLDFSAARCYSDITYHSDRRDGQGKITGQTKINGLGMLIYQAILSAELMLKTPVPLELFDTIYKEITE
jgi:shikimate 5-dehydrogenase